MIINKLTSTDAKYLPMSIIYEYWFVLRYKEINKYFIINVSLIYIIILKRPWVTFRLRMSNKPRFTLICTDNT